MAVLHRALTADGTALLVKRPRLGIGSHPACFAGFEVEQTILSRLSGPHVPRLADQGENEDGPWIVFEEIAGPSLAAAAARAPLPADEVARLGSAVATALHALHRQNVVHHDLTPAHILFRSTGEAVLIDFGLACHGQLPDLVDDTDDRPLGTPAYLSPEQLAGRRGDPRSDLFALGVVLYQLATGRLPFGTRGHSPACAVGSMSIRWRPAASIPRCPTGSRKSSCAVLRYVPRIATPPLGRWRMILLIPSR